MCTRSLASTFKSRMQVVASFQNSGLKVIIVFIGSNNPCFVGEYKVRATNAHGSCQSTCNLVVKPKRRQQAISTQTSIEQKQEVVTTTKEEVIKQDAPYFKCKPDPVLIAEEGQSSLVLMVTCSTAHAQVEWIKDGRRVKPGEGPQWLRHTATRDGDTWYLIVANVKASILFLFMYLVSLLLMLLFWLLLFLLLLLMLLLLFLLLLLLFLLLLLLLFLFLFLLLVPVGDICRHS